MRHVFVGGEWVASRGGAVHDVVSPATERGVGSVVLASAVDADRAVSAARHAFDFGAWPRMAPRDRGGVLKRIAEEVRARVGAMADAFSAELGAPRWFAEAIATKATQRWEEYATIHERFDFEERRTGKGGHVLIVREPVGVVACIIPWNGPVGTASLKVAPALAAGCTVVVKPAPEAPLSMSVLADAMAAADLPPGVVSVLPADREVGRHLVRHPDVDKVTFTGSTAAGRQVMADCADRVARVTLELGGKSAAIIVGDADLRAAADSLVPACTGNTGQVCAAITRVLVPRERQQELLDVLVPRFESIAIGGPDEPGVQMGPLAAERQRDRVEEYIALGVAEGARLVTGGRRPPGRDVGWFIEPTIFADVDNDMRIAREEIFGPVLCVIPYDTPDEAVDLANDSDYGLSGAVYARDEGAALAIARRLRTGQVSLNAWSTILDQPFGGFKQSGLGREGGEAGLEAFLETKVIGL